MDFDRCLLIGAGGHARVVADTVLALNPDADLVMLDGQYPRLRDNGGFRVIGDLERLDEHLRSYPTGLAAIGDADQRLRFIDRLSAAGFQVPGLIHPTAWVSPRARIGAGTVIMAGAIVQTGASLGRGCIVNTGASVDHDCSLSDGVHIAPGARLAGGVTVGARTWIGIGAVAREYTSIGADVTVGAGAAVVDDIAEGRTVAGVPARAIR